MGADFSGFAGWYEVYFINCYAIPDFEMRMVAQPEVTRTFRNSALFAEYLHITDDVVLCWVTMPLPVDARARVLVGT